VELVGQRPALIMAFMYVTTSSGCSFAITSVQVITAGVLATCSDSADQTDGVDAGMVRLI